MAPTDLAERPVAPDRRDGRAAIALRARGHPGRTALTVGIAIVVVAMVLVPAGALVWESLVDDDTGSLSVGAYAAVYTSSDVWTAVRNTAIVIAIVEVIAVTAGTALAWLITSTDMPLKRWLVFVPLSPLLFPPLLSALGWIFLMTPQVGFLNVGIRAVTGSDATDGPLSIYSLVGVGWVMGLYSVPYVYAVVAPAFENLDGRLDEAARMSGARAGTRFRSVTLRLLAPSIVGGALFAFIVAASEFTVPLLIGTRAQLDFVSTEIYQSVTSFPVNFDEGAALGMGLLLVVAAVTIFQRRVTTRRSYVTVSGRGSSRTVTRLGRWRRPALAAVVAYFALTIALPFAAIVGVSLLSYWRVDSLELTLSNYEFVLFQQSGTIDALVRSATLGVAGASLAVLVALAVVYLTLRRRTRAGAVLETVAALPLGIPSIVFGTGALFAFLYSPIVLYGTLASLLIAYVAHILPITLRPIASSYVQLDASLMEAASMSGASEPRTVATVVVPLLRSGVVSAWGLTFILLLRELPISIMLTTPGNDVISTYLFNLYDSQTFPAVAALAVVVFAVGVVGLVFISFLARLVSRQGVGGPRPSSPPTPIGGREPVT